MNRPFVRPERAATAGQRDARIVVQQLTESAGESRFPVESWSTLVTLFATKYDFAGDEGFKAGQATTSLHTRWEIPYRADIDPDLLDVPKKRRVLYAGREYDVIAAANIGRQQAIELVTVARA